MNRFGFKESTPAWLQTFEVGERRYVECLLADYADAQRQLVYPRSRRSECWRDWEFSSQLFVAVSQSKAGDVRYIVCVERTA